MSSGGLKTPAIVFLGVLLVLLVLLTKPTYLARPEVLGGVIIAQVVFAAVSRYRNTFFMILMAAFLWAGTNAPLQEAWLAGRWLVLAVGALAGFAIYMKDRNHYFGAFHLVAFFCVL